MSAIVGFFNRDGMPADAGTLQKMLDAIHFYGPDARGEWINQAVGLGQLQMHVTPQSKHEQQPLHYQNKTLVADARLDNRDELFVALGLDGRQQATTPDSVLIALAYEKWGEACPTYLEGDYAFAIWEPENQTLYCAVDHISARPLYYFATPTLFAFATDIRALLAHPNIPLLADEEAVARYLGHSGFGYADQTLYQGIVKLRFAHWLKVTTSDTTRKQYWFPFELPAVRFKKMHDYAERLHELLTTAIRHRMRTDYPVAAHLSMGLDSAGVSLLAAQKSPLAALYYWAPPISEQWPAGANDERLLGTQMASDAGTSLHFVDPTVADMMAFVSRPINTFGARSYEYETLVQQDAAQKGIRMILSGFGGDQTISFMWGIAGDLLASGRIFALLRELWQTPRARYRDALRGMLRPLLPPALYSGLFRVPKFTQWPSFIDPEFARRIGWTPDPLPTNKDHATIRRSQHFHLELNMLPQVPATWTQWGEPYGVMYGFPLLDRRVMEFAYNIPPDCYSQQGLDRYIFRAALEGIVPDVIRLNTKSSNIDTYNAIDRRWLHQSWQHLAEEVRQGKWNHSNPWVDMPALRQAILNVPPSEAKSHAIPRTFYPIQIALEMCYLWERQYNIR